MNVKAGEWVWQRNRFLPTIPRIFRFDHPSAHCVNSSLDPWMDGEVSLVYRQDSIPSTLLPSIDWAQNSQTATPQKATPLCGTTESLISPSVLGLLAPVERHQLACGWAMLRPSLAPLFSAETQTQHTNRIVGLKFLPRG